MTSQALTYLLKIDGVKGDSTIKGYEGYFTVDEFTFNELTRLTAGTGGAGAGRSLAQFDPLMVAVAGLPPGLLDLLKNAATGKHITSIDLVGLERSGDSYLKLYDLTLNNVTVAGYAADGQHDTAIAFDFTALKETIASQNSNGSLGQGSTFAFDLAKQGGTINPVNAAALAALAHDHSGEKLTYLLKVDGVKGDSTIRGYEGYFAVDEYTFNELTKFAAGTGGAGAGKSSAQFDPLMVDIAGLPPGLIDLFKDAATGKHITSIDLVGLKQGGDGYQKVSDLTLKNVTVAGFAADGQHDTAIAFDFTAFKETIADQNSDGSLTKGTTFSFDLGPQGGSVNPVNHDVLTAFAHAHSGESLIYLLKVDGVKGDSTIKGYEGYFTVDEFTFNELTKLTAGTGGGGGAGKAQFDPLTVDISGLPPGLIDLFSDAATGKHITSVDLVGLVKNGGGYQRISDLTLKNATVAGYAADGQHDTAIAFDFTAFKEFIAGQTPNAPPSPANSFSFDLAKQGGTINPVNHDDLTAFAHAHSGNSLTYLLKVDGVKGDSTIKGYEGYFTVDEFTFNELTKLTAGTGGGGGAGKVQFDPLTVDIAGLPPGLLDLLKDATTGKHITSVDLVGLKHSGEGFQKVSDLILKEATVAGYAADGQHDTAIAFDFAAFKATIAGQKSDGLLIPGNSFSFDLAKQGGSINAVDHNALAVFAHAHSGEELTYLLKVDGVTGDSTIKGYEGYFAVDEFTFNELTQLAAGGGGGRTGKLQFDPLTVDIAGLSPGLVDLLKDAATGKHITTIDLIGLKQSGDGFEKVSDLTLKNATIAGYAADGGHDTAIAFDFTALKETIAGQNPDGSPTQGSTFSFDLAKQGGSINAVDHNALAAFAHAHSDDQLTYLLKVNGVKGDSTIHGYEGDFTVDEFTFNEFTKFATSGGAGAGKAQFDPLTVDINGLTMGLVDLLKDAATGKHITSIELIGLKQTGDGFEKVTDLTLNSATIAGYAADGQHDTAIAFDFTALKETIAGQNPDGSLNPGHSFSFDLARQGGSILPVDHDHLVAFAHAHSDFFMV